MIDYDTPHVQQGSANAPGSANASLGQLGQLGQRVYATP
jgi:hypothetical protein